MDNYFSLFELPLSLRPDAAEVKKMFYKLSKQYHPDRVAQTDEAAKAEVLQKAAMVNDAYKTLSDPDKTIAYVLRLYKMLEEEEKYELPPAFLMEMMDLNEAVSDYEDAPENEPLKIQAEQALAEQLEAWENQMLQLIPLFEQAEEKEAVLLKIKDFYFRKKYLLRIKERFSTFASR
ncbi:MAG: DnaJ domain-containing protein [Bacteroidota bacterium]